MRERPISFSGPMVRALLAGAKTQTRRELKKLARFGAVTEFQASDTKGYQWQFRDKRLLWNDLTREQLLAACPYGVVGDQLWVREATLKVEDRGWVGPVYVESDAGRHALEWGYGESDDPDFIEPYELKTRPPMFMPRRYSRITLELTGVRVERLQAISVADCIAEGAQPLPPDPLCSQVCPEDYVAGYRAIWEQINGPGSWDANPWVWALSFRVIQGAA
jgi:hypothetical protein